MNNFEACNILDNFLVWDLDMKCLEMRDNMLDWMITRNDDQIMKDACLIVEEFERLWLAEGVRN